VLHLNAISDECIVVVTPDPSSFADAYALVKVLHQKYKLQNFKIIFNQLRSNNGAQLFLKFSEVVEKFLSVRLNYIGGLLFDDQLLKAQQMQRLIMRQNDLSMTVQTFKHIAVELMSDFDYNSYSNRSVLKTSGLEGIFRPATGHA
jgi:flagellar biosynthesis protein FlhG